MFKWLDRKTQTVQREEATRFLLSVKGMDKSAIDTLHGVAMFWSNVYASRAIDLYRMERWILTNLAFPSQIGFQIRGLQKEDAKASAAGLMVWHFSSRALLYPEQRIFGRETWRELQRSSYDAEQIAVELSANSGVAFRDTSRERVPEGLDPL